MLKRLVSIYTFALVLASISFMYKDSRAQGKERLRPAPAAKTIASAAAPEINYTVSMSKPFTHLLEVEMRLGRGQAPAAAQTELKMPVWTPGSYLIREYSRQVQDFEAKNAATGSLLAWRKISKNTWQIDTAGASEIVVNYKVYSNELTVRTNELNADHAFWNNAALLMFPKGQLAAPSTVKVVPSAGWRVATGLPAAPDGAANTFRAPNYDVLYDSPFEVGNFREIPFTVQGKPHRIVIDGEGNYDPQVLARDFPKIIEEGFKIFGELPFDNYTFIVNLRGGGGLEHMNSTALQANRFGFKPESRYQNFLGLVAHEYFHLWNVKRIRPDALGPFDYENENYTRLLWVAEGATAYYESVLLRRAGLISESKFLEDAAATIQQLQARPGRFETSLEDASFDAWIKYYRPDENAVNNQISYYDKGGLVNMMLDLTIRSASNGQKSLDDVFRYLYNEYYKKNRNYTPADYQKIAEMMAGKSLDEFFSKYVRGTAEIEYDQILGPIGLRLVASEPNASRAYIGGDIVEDNGRVNVRSVTAGTPAYDLGLNAGDQIVAIDGNRASLSFLQSYIAEKKPGETVRLTIFRFDQLREIPITLGANTRKEYKLEPVENPSAEQKRLYADYLKAELK